MRNLLSGKTFAIAVLSANRSAATTNLNGVSVDCQKYRSVAAMVEWGSIASNAVTSLHWQGSADGTTWHNLEGTKVVVATDDDDGITVTGLDQPVDRYNRLVVVRGTGNAALRTALYMAGWPRDTDVVHGTDVQEVAWFASPAVGTP